MSGDDGNVRSLLQVERRGEIKRRLLERGSVRVSALSKEFDVSEVTIRNDLADLEKEGVAVRIHGGAVLPHMSPFERDVREKEALFQKEKRAIGARAAALIQDQETVMIDVGTTAMEIVRNLPETLRALVVVRSLDIALELERFPGIETIVTGGMLRPSQHSLVNPFTAAVLDQIRADKLFLSCIGFSSEHGVTNFDLREADAKQAMIRASNEVIVVADGSKIGNVARTRVAPAASVDVLITDTGADPGELDRIRQAGVEVVTVHA